MPGIHAHRRNATSIPTPTVNPAAGVAEALRALTRLVHRAGFAAVHELADVLHTGDSRAADHRAIEQALVTDALDTYAKSGPLAVLDIGSGTGAWWRSFLSEGSRDVTYVGIDRSRHAVARGRRLGSKVARADLQRVTLTEVLARSGFDGVQFDLALLAQSLQFLTDPNAPVQLRALFHEVARRSKYVVILDEFPQTVTRVENVRSLLLAAAYGVLIHPVSLDFVIEEAHQAGLHPLAVRHVALENPLHRAPITGLIFGHEATHTRPPGWSAP